MHQNQLQQTQLKHSVVTAAQLTDRELTIKLSIAQSTDRVDLSNCELSQLPPELFELTNLLELSLAGNQLTQLPPELGRLSCLQRLVLAGNWLEQLPQELWGLTQLEGLWVHGNMLRELPQQVGQLTKLKMLSLAGNQLQQVPDSLTELVRLQDLNLSGNALQQLPPGMSALTALTMLSLHGNRLQQLPQHGWQQLASLKEVTLQGNCLQQLPDSFAQLRALTELSLADNQLASLPADLSGWANLQKFHCYGNSITELPLGPRGLPTLLPAPRDAAESAAAASRKAATTAKLNSGYSSVSSYEEPEGSSRGSSSAAAGSAALRSVDASEGDGGRLVSLWLEGNPLSAAAALGAVQQLGAAGTTRVGLDEAQLAGAAGHAVQQQAAAGNGAVRRGIILGGGPGYFKLQLGRAASSSDDDERVLVVAFGSAPGLPNWGGVMRQVSAAAEAPEHSNFDVLYVVDPHRSWYCGGDPELMEARYGARLRQYTQRYKHVVMVGDSMGATGALLFSPQATSVLAFCPQVDLSTSSIRPGQPPAWQAALQTNLQAAVRGSTARIKVITGTWQHDVDQANLLGSQHHVVVKVYSVESHRLALALARQRKLAPLVREAVLQELGLQSGNVRLANLL